MANAVPAVLGSAAFQQAWKAALPISHAELIAVLRHHNKMLTLPASNLPADLPVPVTLIQNQDLKTCHSLIITLRHRNAAADVTRYPRVAYGVNADHRRSIGR
ncbi:hypothetical protein ACFV2X_27900 [Streptomyces sp. NPDC059679]|uniref:hypothetical protein n=1 Tax=Streptomyces sp. NPDC059679 TaxID=3346903 RepID=UPI0036C4B309